MHSPLLRLLNKIELFTLFNLFIDSFSLFLLLDFLFHRNIENNRANRFSFLLVNTFIFKRTISFLAEPPCL